jgi:mRNA interferase MazF
MAEEFKRNQIYYANLGDGSTGSEQSGMRPVLIIQNNIGNKYSPTVIVACLTSKIYKNEIPTHVRINAKEYNLPSDSLILCEQIKTIDKSRLLNYVAILSPQDERRVNAALRLSINI